MDKEKLVDAIQRAAADYVKTLPPESNGAQLIYAHRVGFARAALEAVIPSLIEECAKVAETKADHFREELNRMVEANRMQHAVTDEARMVACDDIATDIRSLIPSKEKDHG